MGCQFLPDENLKKEVRQNKKKDWRLFYDWINLAPKIWYFVLFFFPVQLSGHRIKTVDKVAEEWHRKYDHLMLYSHTLVGKENEFYVTGINDFLCTSKMYCTLMQVPAELKNVKGKACLINLCYILACICLIENLNRYSPSIKVSQITCLIWHITFLKSFQHAIFIPMWILSTVLHVFYFCSQSDTCIGKQFNITVFCF